jgi:hypothetical protein
MPIGRPTKPLNVTPEEKEKLAGASPKSTQAIAMRARIALACTEGLSSGQEVVHHEVTVCKWRERFRVKRLEGLLDEPRPGAPRSITGSVANAVGRSLIP